MPLMFNIKNIVLIKEIKCNISIKNFKGSQCPKLEFPRWLSGKEYSYNAGDTGDLSSVPELGRFPGGGNGNPL